MAIVTYENPQTGATIKANTETSNIKEIESLGWVKQGSKPKPKKELTINTDEPLASISSRPEPKKKEETKKSPRYSSGRR